MPDVPTTPRDASVRQLAAGFESLGGHGHGAEFAGFQKSCGANEFGLLSWADLDPGFLIRALETDLDGVGEPENTIVFKTEHSSAWWTKDARFWMAMPSFLPADEVPEDIARARLCQRLREGRVRLLEELRRGEKIFVFRSLVRVLKETELARLHAAVRRLGGAALLYVRASDTLHPPGLVEDRGDGLMVGYMERFVASAQGDLLGPVHEDWVALCRRTLDVFLSHSAGVDAVTDVVWLVQRAGMLDAAGRRDEAVAAARRAVALDPRSAAARVRLAWGLWGLGFAGEALEHAMAAVVVEPGCREGYRIVEGLMREAGDPGAVFAEERAAAPVAVQPEA